MCPTHGGKQTASRCHVALRARRALNSSAHLKGNAGESTLVPPTFLLGLRSSCGQLRSVVLALTQGIGIAGPSLGRACPPEVS